MRSTTKHIILSTLLCILTLAVFLVFYSKLPQSVPVHFDSAGNPNSFWPRNALVFGGPAAFSVINLIVAFRLKAQEGNPFYTTLRLCLPLLSQVCLSTWG